MTGGLVSKWLVLCLVFCWAVGAYSATETEVSAMLEKLPEHPRLLLLRGEEKGVLEGVAKDAGLKAVWGLVKATADEQLKAPVLERKLEGRRLLGVSRECLKRILNLGLAYRLTGDKRYAERARQEMLAVAAFSDWNPSHFLDVAEMTTALAIGVDWLHGDLDDASRAAIHKAIIDKGLKASIGNDGWARGDNNWNQVCNGGMLLGALATEEDDPQLAQKMITRAVEGVPFAMKGYEPDGAYPEGAAYWDYGTTYNVVILAAMEKALGSDLGLSRQRGFDRTARYFLHVAGPTGLWFNYADSGQRRTFDPSPAMYWLAVRQNDESLLWDERAMLDRLVADPSTAKPSRTGRFLPMLLVWGRPQERERSRPAERHFLGDGVTPVALFRSGWDQDATFVGIKGGRASAPHGHMDVGTFVIDATGERWAEDLGAQDYNSIESIGMNLWNRAANSDRWRIFWLSAASHNVLMVDGKDHQVDGVSQFVEHSDHSAALDLSAVFAGQLKSARREVVLNPDGRVILTDQVSTNGAVTVRWAMMTRAAVEILPDGAILRRDGKALQLRVRGLAGVKVKAYASDPPPAAYDARNEGTRMVGFEVKVGENASGRWEVEFVPQR